MVGAERTYVRIHLWGSTTMPRGAGMPCTCDGRVVWGHVGAPAIVGHIWIWGCMCEREDIAVASQHRLTSLSER